MKKKTLPGSMSKWWVLLITDLSDGKPAAALRYRRLPSPASPWTSCPQDSCRRPRTPPGPPHSTLQYTVVLILYTLQYTVVLILYTLQYTVVLIHCRTNTVTVCTNTAMLYHTMLYIFQNQYLFIGLMKKWINFKSYFGPDAACNL